MSKPKLTVIISLDVEEEGLFSGSYQSTGCGVENIALLRKLSPLTHELGFPLTLFCAHTVFTNATACNHLAYMRDHCNAEIALHLHHWSTPPIDKTDPRSRPLPSDRMPGNLLRQKLQNLVLAGRNFQGAPLTSFRMGRWDFKKILRPMLTDFGITVDSSVCPLRAYPQGPDFFLAPADPYWADTAKPLLVLPITQIPVLPALTRIWYVFCRHNQKILDTFHFWNVASANPVWHKTGIMQYAARSHSRRGGQVLSLFWHSSEMLPGASPNVPDANAADKLQHKIYSFLSWLKENFEIEALTAAQYYANVRAQTDALPRYSFVEKGDW